MIISDEAVIEAMENTGRGWVIEVDARVVAFAIGNAQTGNIWALFVEPAYEGRGFGKRLHDAMLSWLWAQGLKRLFLTTEKGTRAQRFYLRAGWRDRGEQSNGEILFEQTTNGSEGKIG